MYRKVFVIMIFFYYTARRQEDEFYLPDIYLILGIRKALVQYNLLRYRLEEYNAIVSDIAYIMALVCPTYDKKTDKRL